MKVEKINIKNEVSGEVELPKSLVTKDFRYDLIQQVIRWQLAKRRSGSANTKERNEVSGSTRKLFRQKGRGAARHGSIKAPIFVGGGIVFGPKPRSYEFSVNKKVRALALKNAVGFKCSEKKIKYIDISSVKKAKTKEVSDLLKNFQGSSLFILSDLNTPFAKSVKNIKDVNILNVNGLNVYDILNNDNVFFDIAAQKIIDERLA